MGKKIELPDVEPVHLKPFHGIRPGAIILCGLAGAVLLLFFIICMLPGILSNGSYVSFDINTRNTAVYMDGKYLGSTEGSVYFVPSGHHEFSFSILGADAGSAEISIPDQLFFTLFHHRITPIEYAIGYSGEIERAVTENAAREAARWSRILSYTESYHYPPVFTPFAENAAALGFSDVSDPLLYMAMHITSDEMENDFRESLKILDKAGIPYSSDALDTIIAVLDGNAPEAPAKEAIAIEPPVYDSGLFTYSPASFVMGNTASDSYPGSKDRFVKAETGAFSIAADSVSEYEYALFVAENPYWAKSNKDTLIADGMADGNYLADVTLSTSVRSGLPIRSISWYAADAYCRWLSEKTGMNIVLPSEAEWTLAAYSASEKPYTSSLLSIDNDNTAPKAMMGQLWEFTSTSFIPLARFVPEDAERLASLYPYDDVVVKGGSWINTPDMIDADTSGAMDRSACSVYAGFRIGVR